MKNYPREYWRTIVVQLLRQAVRLITSSVRIVPTEQITTLNEEAVKKQHHISREIRSMKKYVHKIDLKMKKLIEHSKDKRVRKSECGTICLSRRGSEAGPLASSRATPTQSPCKLSHLKKESIHLVAKGENAVSHASRSISATRPSNSRSKPPRNILKIADDFLNSSVLNLSERRKTISDWVDVEVKAIRPLRSKNSFNPSHRCSEIVK